MGAVGTDRTMTLIASKPRAMMFIAAFLAHASLHTYYAYSHLTRLCPPFIFISPQVCLLNSSDMIPVVDMRKRAKVSKVNKTVRYATGLRYKG